MIRFIDQRATYLEMAGPLNVARPPQDQVVLPGWITDPTRPVATGRWPVLADAAPPVSPRRQLP
jgi:hypothetical protein